jgi:hypothetical protein
MMVALMVLTYIVPSQVLMMVVMLMVSGGDRA